jgi:hypothetical protein
MEAVFLITEKGFNSPEVSPKHLELAIVCTVTEKGIPKTPFPAKDAKQLPRFGAGVADVVRYFAGPVDNPG